METLYRKVIIDGKEENLPKEAGTYIACRKNGDIFQDEYFAGRNSMTRWTDYIDWYLQLIDEQPTELTVPSEDEKKSIEVKRRNRKYCFHYEKAILSTDIECSRPFGDGNCTGVNCGRYDNTYRLK